MDFGGDNLGDTLGGAFGKTTRSSASAFERADDNGGDDAPVGGCCHPSGREIIHISVGKAGCGMGHEFIRDLAEEHGVEYKNEDLRGTCQTGDAFKEAHLDVFFNEGQRHRSGRNRWVPRAILVDLNMQDLNSTVSGPLGHLYKPENVVGNDEGSGNCFAKAFHTEGADVAEIVMELVRKETEKCNCLQGVQFTHGIQGGTGSGVTSLLLRMLRDHLESSKCLMQTFTLVPAPGINDIPLEPYNAALAFQDLLEYSDQCFLFDNQALQNICTKSRGLAVPSTNQMNNIVALCMSGLTSGLRFKGPLNADLWKMHTSLVPFKNAHFLISSFAPLVSEASKGYRKTGNVLDLAQQMLMKDNVTVKCDPLNPGDASNNIPKARILASWASWRGKFPTQEVDRVLHDMWKPGSRYDCHYPDWIPNPIASNVCVQEHCDQGDSVVYVANNTAVSEVMQHMGRNWDKMFKTKSYLHVFEKDGIAEEDMRESRKNLEYIESLYVNWAQRPDKILDTEHGLQINAEAIENPDHEEIAQEMKELSREDCMYLEMCKGRGG